MIADLFSIISPVLVCVGIGFFLARSGRRFDLEQLTTIVTNIGAPCLAFHTLANIHVDEEAFGTIVIAALSALAICAAVGYAILTWTGLPRRAYLPALVFPNSGNMGLPLCFLAFGDLGLGLAIAVFSVNSASHFTIGVAIASGQASLRALARVPILYAIPPAIVFMVTGETPPRWVNAVTDLLGGVTIPMMLIALGHSLARLRVRSVPRSVALATLRLVMGFAVGVCLAEIFGLEGAARGVLIIQSAMPAAVFNYLFALRYQTDPEGVAGVVVASTALSFATLPLLLWYVL